MKETSSKEKQTTREFNIPGTEIAEKALKNYEQALRTGFKLQEEAGKWWTSMVTQAGLAQDWQKRVNEMSAIANSLMPAAQSRMQDVLSLMEKNSKAGSDLVKKAVEAAQTPVVAESQAKWMDFWASSLGTVRSNAEAVSTMSSKAIDSWIEFVRKNTEVTELRVPKST